MEEAARPLNEKPVGSIAKSYSTALNGSALRRSHVEQNGRDLFLVVRAQQPRIEVRHLGDKALGLRVLHLANEVESGVAAIDLQSGGKHHVAQVGTAFAEDELGVPNVGEDHSAVPTGVDLGRRLLLAPASPRRLLGRFLALLWGQLRRPRRPPLPAAHAAEGDGGGVFLWFRSWKGRCLTGP